MVDSIPHSWLFPRVAAVIHHGGAGTTAAGLRAGVPAIVILFFGDQLFWGQRDAKLGVGPEPILRKQLTVERLAQAIQTAVTDQSMRQRAATGDENPCRAWDCPRSCRRAKNRKMRGGLPMTQCNIISRSMYSNFS
jgi:hypothetical protein